MLPSLHLFTDLVGQHLIFPASLLRFCDTLRRTDNGDTADAIMQYMKKGDRVGYFRIAAIRERSS